MIAITGFRENQPESASGKPLTGRVVCHDVQWTGEGDDALCTFTFTARELLSAADSNLLWTDQGVQRGVKPEWKDAPNELSLLDGYPDAEKYIFVSENADDIAEKLLYGKKLFLSPLIWNLRPGMFEAFFDLNTEDLHIYQGKIFLPDSHHRHQAILKASRLYQENPNEYPSFSLDKQFKIELYFLSREDEGNYFFDKNQRTRQTARSKAYDLTTEDALSLLAKNVIKKSDALKNNVNRVTDRLTGANEQVVTLSTLREMMKSVVKGDYIDEEELEGTAAIVAQFYDMMAKARPELAYLSAKDRRTVRKDLMVDAAVMMHGYARLVSDYITDISALGKRGADRKWLSGLQRLSSATVYTGPNWEGDLFEKANPLWRGAGILKPNARGTGLAQVNNGATRSTAARILRTIIESDHEITDVSVIENSANA